jgi:tetratricopeptide (TPR) repeat protein
VTRAAALALLGLFSLGPVTAVRADVDVRRAAPLVVPRGPLPEPESAAALSTKERVRIAAAALRERGHRELPVLAWALLDAARSQQQIELAGLAVELAPSSPGVRFEAARLTGSPIGFVSAIGALARDLPGLLWLIALLGFSLLGGLLVLTAGLCLAAALRGLPLHGHAFGHSLTDKKPAAWPGLLICGAVLCVLPLFGVGPVVLIAAAGALGALRLPRGQNLQLALALIALGATLGLGLDRVTPALIAGSRESDLIAAWRIDRGEALPGDLERLERASERRPDEMLYRFALATDWKRRGELGRAARVLGDPSAGAEPTLLAAVFNLRGIVHLAQGKLSEAIPAFELARSAEESSSVMFNLSQAYGRALLLSEQESAFLAASALDPEITNRYLAADGSNLHSVLIQTPLSPWLYLARALVPSLESRALASELRWRLLGPLEREQLWLALPVLGALAFILRRSSVTRCSRCRRPLCARCSREAMQAGICSRCVRLFVKRELIDPRMRKQQLELDRRRNRKEQIRLGTGALIAPGSADILEGRGLRGMAALFALGLGLALVRAPLLLPLPWELASLGVLAPYTAGVALLALLYARGLTQAFGKLLRLRRAG